MESEYRLPGVLVAATATKVSAAAATTAATTTAAAAITTTATAATTAAAITFFARTSFVHHEVSALEVFAIHLRDGILSAFAVFHFDKREAA